jgi:hypothetical protein
MTGLRDSIEKVKKELEILYADIKNHQFLMPLCRAPSDKEFGMIKAYIKKKF